MNITLDGREPRHVQRLGYPLKYYECYLINSQEQQSELMILF